MQRPRVRHSAVLAVLATFFVAAPAHAVQSDPPVITSQPPALTNSTSASFSFDGESGGQFLCSLDGSMFEECSSPQAYTDLVDGPHTFQVEQTVCCSQEPSEPVEADWTVDTQPPGPPTITSAPPSLTNSSSASFSFTGEPNGTYACAVDGGSFAACSSPVSLSGLSDGAHTFRVRETDGAGNTGPSSAASWTVDTTAPAAPAFTGTPAPSSDETSATISFSGESGGGFSCSLDGGAFAACTDPVQMAGLSVADHSFAVRQTDAAGNTGEATILSWTVVAAPTSPSSVKGSLSSSVFVDGRSVDVGCSIDEGSLAACTVTATPVGGSGRAIAAGVIGRGHQVLGRRGTRQTTVHIVLNRSGRLLLAHRLRGVRVRFDIKAQPYDDLPLRTSRIAVIRASNLRVVPSFPQFGADSAKVSPSLHRYLAHIVRLVSPVKSITCIGFTASSGDPKTADYRRHLGLQRSRAVCAVLRSLGVKATLVTISNGGLFPVASNRTKQGRARNRRVELVVHR